MGLGTTWWTNKGQGPGETRWRHNFDFLYAYCWGWPTEKYVSVQIGSFPPTGYDAMFRMYQEPAINLTAVGELQNRDKDQYNQGFFYAKERTSGDLLFPVTTHIPQPNDTGPAFRAVPLLPDLADADLEPNTGGAESAAYVTPWLDPQWWDPSYALGDTIFVEMYFPDVPGTWDLYHYNPLAWAGTPPAVAAAAVMAAGLDAGYIEQALFDDAHDEYAMTTGAEPYASWPTDPGYWVFARWALGQKLSDFLMEVARHGRDHYYVNEKGNFAISSWTNPPTVSGLGLADGVLDNGVLWTDTDRYIFNRAFCTYGQANKSVGYHATGFPDDSSYDLQAINEPKLDSYMGDLYENQATIQNSIDLFGELWLKGAQYLDTARLGLGFDLGRYFPPTTQEVTRAHFPLQLHPGAAIWGTFPNTRTVKVPVLWDANSDSKARKEITVRQDLRGADYGIGYQVTDVELTCDGATVDDTRCIEKVYDFDALTTTSTLLEVPAND